MRLDEFRNELPFGDDELRAIREQVMHRIAKEPQRESRWLGMFLRASLAAAALVLVFVRPTQEKAVRVVESPTRPVVEALTAPPSTTRRLEDSTPRRRRKPRPPVQRASRPEEPSAPAPVRIELQTSNPDIRILWITNPSGETR